MPKKMFFSRFQSYIIHFRPIAKCSMHCSFCYLGQQEIEKPMGVFQYLTGTESFDTLNKVVLNGLTAPGTNGRNLLIILHGGDALQTSSQWLEQFCKRFRELYPEAKSYCVSNCVTKDFETKLQILHRYQIQLSTSLNSEMLKSNIWKQHVVRTQQLQDRMMFNSLFFPADTIEFKRPLKKYLLNALPSELDPLKCQFSIEYLVDTNINVRILNTNYYQQCANKIIELFKDLNDESCVVREIFAPILEPFINMAAAYQLHQHTRTKLIDVSGTICSGMCSRSQLIVDQNLQYSTCSKHFDAEAFTSDTFMTTDILQKAFTTLSADLQCQTCQFNKLCQGACPNIPIADNTLECQHLRSVVSWLIQSPEILRSYISKRVLYAITPSSAIQERAELLANKHIWC